MRALTKLLPTSLRSPRFSPEAESVYREAIRLLDHEGIPFLVGGAVAVNAHTGVWRETKDLDVFAREADVPLLLDIFAQAGFEIETTDPVWLSKAKRGAYFIDVIHRNANGTGDVGDDWFTNAKPVSLFGHTLMATPAEETLLSKMFVGFRDRWDASDILHILFASGGDLDWDRILEKANDHWPLLFSYLNLYLYVYPSHAHYVPRYVWDALLARLHSELDEVNEGPREAPFRGTMLDAVSFQVDVNEWGLGPDAREAARLHKGCDGTDPLVDKALLDAEEHVGAS